MCRSLSDYFEVHVITYHLGRAGAYPFKIHRIWWLPFKPTVLNDYYQKAVCDVFLALKVLLVVVREDLQLLHGHMHEGALIGEFVGKLLGIPTLYDAHNSLVQLMVERGFIKEASFIARILAFIERKINVSAAFVTSHSRLLVKKLVEDGVAVKRIEVIPDATRVSDFSVSGLKIRNRYGWGNYKIIFYSGGFYEYQGVDVLLHAFGQITKERKDVVLVLFGELNVPHYRNKVEGLELTNVVFVCTEPYENLPEYLAAADVAVVPRLASSHGHGVPGKIMDYLASGVPMVASDISEVREVIQNGETGILVEPGNVQKLVDGIMHILNNPGLAAKLRSNSKRLAEEKYNWDKNAQRLERIYESFLSQNVTGRSKVTVPRVAQYQLDLSGDVAPF
jgi:glycosyltransferase involved in cell wall biosynthesis